MMWCCICALIRIPSCPIDLMVLPVSVGLVVSGDGRGTGEDTTGSGGVGTAACSAMRASMDADIGGSDSSVSNASVSPAEGTGSTIGIAEESAD
ncbi:hypothetical protein Tco_1254552 [Tanacetum coccineum]